MICPQCAEEFIPHSRRQRYCSQECKRRAQKKSDVPSGPGGPDREITELTVYLVHKYAAEGMMEPEIAGILKRSAASVHEAIERPLKPYQQECLQEFLKGR